MNADKALACIFARLLVCSNSSRTTGANIGSV
jgi:hypothetical protein